MNKKKAVLICVIVTLFFYGSSFAQVKSIYNKEFQAKVEKDMQEFFKNAPQYLTKEYKPIYLDREIRVEIKTKPLVSGENLKRLSSVILLNKYNPELKRDTRTTFNPETFNPLKYNFSFYANTDQVYRVDSTNYIIIIHPQEK